MEKFQFSNIVNFYDNFILVFDQSAFATKPCDESGFETNKSCNNVSSSGKKLFALLIK